jgi:hypothetical protein
MRKILILNSAFLILHFFSSAQVFILGGKGILNYSMLKNSSVIINGDKVDRDFTMAGQGGIYFRYYFNEATYYSGTNISIAIELLFGSYGQKYIGTYTDTASGYSVASKVSINSMDIPIMIHLRGQAGLYGEFGVSFGMINGIKQEYSRSPENANFKNFSGASVDSSFVKNNLSGIFGFGIDSELNDHLNLVIGFRATYGFTDLTEPQKSYTPDYSATHSLTVGFVVGVAYILNFFHNYH